MIATVRGASATAQTAAATVRLPLPEAPGPRRTTPTLIATARAGICAVLTEVGEEPIASGTVRMEVGIMAAPGGTAPRL